MLNSSYLIKKKYANNLNNILKQNNFFFFWNLKQISKKEILNLLSMIGFKNIWLKKNLFSILFLKSSNKMLYSLLKNQSFFSYGNLNNININDLYSFLQKYNNQFIFLGIIYNNNLFFDKKRFFENYKTFSSINNKNKFYLPLLNKSFFYTIYQKKDLFNAYQIALYKKNFSIIL